MKSRYNKSKKDEKKTSLKNEIKSVHKDKEKDSSKKSLETSKKKKSSIFLPKKQKPESSKKKKIQVEKVEKTSSRIQGQFLRFQSLYSFFFRDGHLEKGKKITFEATKFLLDKTKKKHRTRIYRKKKTSIFI